MRTLRFQHVSIPRPPGSASQEVARRFYSGLLGLCEIPVPATLSASDLIWFQVGDAELHVFAEPAFDTAAAQHFCLEVPDLDALRERLAAAGFAIMAGSGISGRPRFFCRDPFGNNIEFTTIIGDYRLG